MRARIHHLEAVYDYAYRSDIQVDAGTPPRTTPEQRAKVPPVVHPVVRLHDVTGRPALFVNEDFTPRILGVPDEESRALPATIFEASLRLAVRYRHQWRASDLVVWDSRALIHLATGCRLRKRGRFTD